jgi:SM-20-related protein
MRAAGRPHGDSVASGSFTNVAAIDAASPQHRPFDHVIVRDFVSPQHLGAILHAFPSVPGPGSHPPASLNIGKPFAALLAELQGEAFRAAIERKFAVDLADKPTITTIRGELRASDGAIHTDSRCKIITVLLYLNREWNAPGGRLRLLGSPDLDDWAVEIAPEAGMLVAFRRSDRSWHGHARFIGPRRAVQMSYVRDRATALREERRHRLATSLKGAVHRLLPPGRA